MKKGRPTNFGPIRAFLANDPVNVTPCNLCARAKVKGHRKLKKRTNPFPGKIGRGVLNLVALALTVIDGVIQQSVRKGLERKKELRRQVKHQTYPLVWQARSQPARWGGGLNLDGWNTRRTPPPLGHCPRDVINLKNAPTLGHSQAPPPWTLPV